MKLKMTKVNENAGENVLTKSEPVIANRTNVGETRDLGHLIDLSLNWKYCLNSRVVCF